MGWQKKSFSFSHGKKSWPGKLNLNDANLDTHHNNEDCIFVDNEDRTPLICCDGVGSSENPEEASVLLTMILSGLRYEQISAQSLAEYFQVFYDQVYVAGASTTCLAIWPIIRKNKLYLKVLQMGDGLAYLVLHGKNGPRVKNLSFAPINILSSNGIPNHSTSDFEAILELNDEKCMLPPNQISLATKDLPTIFFTLGENFNQSKPMTLVEGLKNKIFYRHFEFDLEKVKKFDLVVGSDGIYDNITLPQLYEDLETSNFANLFRQAAENMQRTDFSPIEDLDFPEEVKGDLSFSRLQTIAENYPPLVFEYSNISCLPRDLVLDHGIDDLPFLQSILRRQAFWAKFFITPKWDDMSLIAQSYTRY